MNAVTKRLLENLLDRRSREWCLRHFPKSNFGVLWHWRLTSWPLTSLLRGPLLPILQQNLFIYNERKWKKNGTSASYHLELWPSDPENFFRLIVLMITWTNLQQNRFFFSKYILVRHEGKRHVEKIMPPASLVDKKQNIKRYKNIYIIKNIYM